MKSQELHSHTPPVLVRADALTAIGLLPFLSFMSRRPYITRGDAIEFALFVLLECRMLLSATGYLPLSEVEQSRRGVLLGVGVLVLLNVVIFLTPALHKQF